MKLNLRVYGLCIEQDALYEMMLTNDKRFAEIMKSHGGGFVVDNGFDLKKSVFVFREKKDRDKAIKEAKKMLNINCEKIDRECYVDERYFTGELKWDPNGGLS